MKIESVDQMRWSDALKIGIAQAFALIPERRAGATIIGGMLFGLSRPAATGSRFSGDSDAAAATGYELVRNRDIGRRRPDNDRRRLVLLRQRLLWCVGCCATWTSRFRSIAWYGSRSAW